MFIRDIRVIIHPFIFNLVCDVTETLAVSLVANEGKKNNKKLHVKDCHLVVASGKTLH